MGRGGGEGGFTPGSKTVRVRRADPEEAAGRGGCGQRAPRPRLGRSPGKVRSCLRPQPPRP